MNVGPGQIRERLAVQVVAESGDWEPGSGEQNPTTR
jgi:hypothetical protein